MEVLSERVVFSNSSDERARRCKVVQVNFRRLKDSVGGGESVLEWSCEGLLHAVAGVCSVSLPDMELSAIYSSLTAAGTKSVVIVCNKQNVLQERSESGAFSKEKAVHSAVDCAVQPDCKPYDDKDTPATQYDRDRNVVARNGGVVSEDLSHEEHADCSTDQLSTATVDEDSPFADLFSASEDSDDDSEACEDEFAVSREKFLSEARQRKLPCKEGSEVVGPEHCVVGCATTLRLTSKPGGSAVQITLLAVRKSWRRRGVGRYLMQCCKDPDVVGHYDVLVVFADHKAEGFFSRHSFTDDPVITSKYRGLVDHWVNSTLMAYLTPFSGPSTAGVGSLRALTNFEDHLKHWRVQAIGSYCDQLSFMERLRHEVLLLHSKVQSQEDMIAELSRQLRVAREEKGILQSEFSQYRKHVQKLLCDAAIGSAENWLRTAENEDSQ